MFVWFFFSIGWFFASARPMKTKKMKDMELSIENLATSSLLLARPPCNGCLPRHSVSQAVRLAFKATFCLVSVFSRWLQLSKTHSPLSSPRHSASCPVTLCGQELSWSPELLLPHFSCHLDTGQCAPAACFSHVSLFP